MPSLTSKATLRLTLAAGAAALAVIFGLIPDTRRQPPSNIGEFAHLTAARLNAQELGEFRVIAATVGQEQLWITAQPGVCEKDLLDKHKTLTALPRWKDTAVVFHNDVYGTIAAAPAERAAGCVTTLGSWVIWGDPELLRKIVDVWNDIPRAE